MGYRKPEDVVAPKSRWELGTVLCNTGQGGWAVAEGSWDDEPAVGIRWNGDDDLVVTAARNRMATQRGS